MNSQSVWRSLDPRRNLGARLAWVVGLISVLLALLISLLVGESARRQVADEIGSLHAQYADQLSQELDNDLYMRLQNMRVVGGLINSQSSLQGPADQRRMLEDLQSIHPDYVWLGLADVSGKITVATDNLLVGRSVAEQDWFAQGRFSPYVGDVRTDATSDELTFDNATNHPQRFVDIVAPVLDVGGKRAGVLVARLNWVWAGEIEQQTLAAISARRNVDAFILNAQGAILLGPGGVLSGTLDLPGILKSPAHSGYSIDTWADGQTYLTGYAHSDGSHDFKGLGWTVLVREPVGSALASATDLQWRTFLSSLGLGLLFAVLGWLVLRRFVSPLNRIAVVADNLRLNPMQMSEIPVVPGEDEVARVSQSLHSLVTDLEDRVLQRTREIERLSVENREAAVTRERLRMARELHDTLAHTLAGLLTEIRLLHKMASRLELAANPLTDELAHAEDAARTGLQEARAAIANLRSNPAREYGLQLALRQAAEQFVERTGINAEYRVIENAADLSDMRAETMYRIAEEALRNIERHAHAARVRVTFREQTEASGQAVCMTIEDDGLGFDPSAPMTGHYGLRGMREQAELIGATLMIKSRPGQGTQLQLTLQR